MQQDLPRSGLNGSPLFALLAQWGLVDPQTPRQSFVAGMGHWLGWKEAIVLSAALQAPLGQAASRGSAALPSPAAQTALEKEFARVRLALGHAIADPSATAREDGSSFVPFRRHYTNLQHNMAGAIAPLREQARAAVQLQSPPLSQLAALDAAMSEVLGARESSLLALLPVLLEKHFKRLQQVPHKAAWLEVFRQDMKRLLAAELELRLQPAQGLLDTLREMQPVQPVQPAEALVS